MTEPLYAGFDLGTTFFKVGLYNAEGDRVGLGRRAFEKDTDAEGRCTVPVTRFREILSDAFKDALAEAGRAPGDVTAVSYCSQANTFLLLNAGDQPLTPLVVWSDRRAAPFRDELAAMSASDRFLERSGQGIALPECIPAKLDWFRRHEPATWERAARIMTISDLLAWLLTGRRIGDSGTASLTGLWDVRRSTWNLDLTGLLEIDPGMLPEWHRPGSHTAEVSRSGTEWLGIPEGTPFTVGALDHHTAALGGGIGRMAPVSVSFGTSLVCFRFEEEYRPIAGACIGPATDAGRFYRITFSAPGASAMDDYREQVQPDQDYDPWMEQAEPVAPGCDGLRADIEEGALQFHNRNSAHGEAHCIRAVMELTGRTTAALLRDLVGGEETPLPSIIAVGGAARSDLWMKVIGETAGIRVIPARPADTASRGAAMFAAVAAGQFGNLEECASTWCGGKELGA